MIVEIEKWIDNSRTLPSKHSQIKEKSACPLWRAFALFVMSFGGKYEHGIFFNLINQPVLSVNSSRPHS